MPLLDYVLAGIKQAESRVATHTDSRLPITIQVLRSLKLVWLSPPSHPDSIMLWAASCVGFFGFLRAGEFTVPSPRSYDASVHLSLSDLAVDSHTTPSMIRLRIKQSKTDPCRRGWPFFYLGGGSNVCRHLFSSSHATVSGLCNPPPGPLLVFQSGSPLNLGQVSLSSPGCTSKGRYSALCI